jgi:hypothetical protein
VPTALDSAEVDPDGPCPICGAPPPRRGSLGWLFCDHQIAALDEKATP